MSEEQIIQFLQDNCEYMVNNDIVMGVFRTIGWWIVKGMAFMADAVKKIYDYTFRLVDITAWTGVDNWIKEYKPLISVMVTATLMILGFMYMFGKNKKHNVLTSVLIFSVVVTSSTYLFSTFNTWTIMFKDAVVGEEGIADGKALINSNLTDLWYIDDQIGLKNMSDGNRPKYPSLSEKSIQYIKINDVMNWKRTDNPDTKDILKKKLVFKSPEVSELEDVSNGKLWTSIGNDMYYRFHFTWFTFLLDALAMLLVYFCLAYKNVRIAYELLIGRVLLTLKSADMSSEKKTVKLLACIRDQYFALCFTAITIRSYFIFTGFIKENVESGFIRGMLVLFLAFCVIDGSNIMQQLTGVDAGLTSMTGKLMAATHLAQGGYYAWNQHKIMNAMNSQVSSHTGKDENNTVDYQSADHNSARDDSNQNEIKNQEEKEKMERDLNGNETVEKENTPDEFYGSDNQNSISSETNQESMRQMDEQLEKEDANFKNQEQSKEKQPDNQEGNMFDKWDEKNGNQEITQQKPQSDDIKKMDESLKNVPDETYKDVEDKTISQSSLQGEGKMEEMDSQLNAGSQTEDRGMQQSYDNGAKDMIDDNKVYTEFETNNRKNEQSEFINNDKIRNTQDKLQNLEEQNQKMNKEFFHSKKENQTKKWEQ